MFFDGIFVSFTSKDIFFEELPKFSQNFGSCVFFFCFFLFFLFFFVFFVFLVCLPSLLLFSGSLTFLTKRFLRMRFVK